MNEPATMPTWFRSRRIRFQLTPLMDLLLIIVFAQFLDVRDTSRDQIYAADERRRQAIEQRSRLTDQLDRAAAARDAAIAERDAAMAIAEINMAESDAALERLKRWLSFEDISQNAAAADASTEWAAADPEALVRFLVGYEELLKRAEIWTVHASSGGEITFSTSGQSTTFRLEESTQSDRTEEASGRLFAAYKRAPQPKGLVVILVSFDPRSVAGVYQPLVDAVPLTLQQLRTDNDATRFEYTVLGPTSAP